MEKTCENCRQPFRVTRQREATRKYCSSACKFSYEAAHGRTAAQVPAVNFECRECSKPFTMKPSYLAAYQKRFGKDPLYCSIPCSALGRRKDSDERHKTCCKNCGKTFYRTRRKGSGTIYNTQLLCSRQCKNEWVSKSYRAKHGLPTITRRIRRKYALLRIPAANGKPFYEILEHRYVMQQQIGRELHKEETVHHVNGDRFNNDISNLELFSSRHGPGQRVVDKVQFAIEILTLYPEFCRKAGYALHRTEHQLPSTG